MGRFLFFILPFLCAICSQAQKQPVFMVKKDSVSVVVQLMDRLQPYKILHPGDTIKVQVPEDELFFFPVAAEVDLNDTYEILIFLRNKKAIGPPKPDIITVTDNVPTDLANTYSTGWTHRSGVSWLDKFNKKTASVSYVAGSKLTTSFNGYKLEWWTEKRINHGKVAISLDGALLQVVDLYENRQDNNTQKVYSAEFAPGDHIVTLELLNEKNPAATELNVIHDTFVFYRK